MDSLAGGAEGRRGPSRGRARRGRAVWRGLMGTVGYLLLFVLFARRETVALGANSGQASVVMNFVVGSGVKDLQRWDASYTRWSFEAK